MEQFKTKKSLKEFLQHQLRHSFVACPGDEQEVDELTHTVLTNLLSISNPDFSIGKFVMSFNKTGQRCFYLYDKEGIKQTFSYNTAIRCYEPLSKRTRLPMHITNMQKAARNEVKDQIDQFAHDNCRCLDQHVDHVDTPFIKLLADWYQQINAKEVEVYRNEDERTMFRCRDISESWQKYHKEHAKLQCISAKENCQKGTDGVKINWLALINQK